MQETLLGRIEAFNIRIIFKIQYFTNPMAEWFLITSVLTSLDSSDGEESPPRFQNHPYRYQDPNL